MVAYNETEVNSNLTAVNTAAVNTKED